MNVHVMIPVESEVKKGQTIAILTYDTANKFAYEDFVESSVDGTVVKIESNVDVLNQKQWFGCRRTPIAEIKPTTEFIRFPPYEYKFKNAAATGIGVAILLFLGVPVALIWGVLLIAGLCFVVDIWKGIFFGIDK